jgi:hypothetical protein
VTIGQAVAVGFVAEHVGLSARLSMSETIALERMQGRRTRAQKLYRVKYII